MLFKVEYGSCSFGEISNNFGLHDVESKPFFPYLYNTTTNLFGQPLPHLPPKSDYFYDSMKLEKRQKFNEWYEANKNQQFDLQEQYRIVCQTSKFWHMVWRPFVEFGCSIVFFVGRVP